MHPSAIKWRTKLFLLYDVILTLVEGRHATDKNAFRLMQMTFKSDPSVMILLHSSTSFYIFPPFLFLYMQLPHGYLIPSSCLTSMLLLNFHLVH